jgi:hypothetical protein
MLVNDVGSRNVYENKEQDDNLPDEKGDISTQPNDISHGSTRILLKPSGFFHCSSAGERTLRHKMRELEGKPEPLSPRRPKPKVSRRLLDHNLDKPGSRTAPHLTKF